MHVCNCTLQGPDKNCPHGNFLYDRVVGHFKLITSPEFLLLFQKAKEATYESYTYWMQQYNQHVQRSMTNKAFSQQETVQHKRTSTLMDFLKRVRERTTKHADKR